MERGAAFDEPLWIERTQKRWGVKSPERIPLELSYIRGIGKVVRWCKDRGVKVLWVSKGGGEYCEEEGRITLNRTTTNANQLFTLLHECGHVKIGTPSRTARFGMGYGVDHPPAEKTLHHRLDMLEEEFEAWWIGWRLGLQLRVLTKGDKVSWDRYRTRALKRYVDWTAKSWRKARRGQPGR